LRKGSSRDGETQPSHFEDFRLGQVIVHATPCTTIAGVKVQRRIGRAIGISKALAKLLGSSRFEKGLARQVASANPLTWLARDVGR
jgi:hypothetical protein